MGQLRNLFPTFRFFHDHRYGLVVVTPYPKAMAIPLGLSHAASYILKVSPDKIEVHKDRSGDLVNNSACIRLFQVVMGLVPDGLMGEQTSLVMQEFNGFVPVERRSSWERLGEDDF